MHTNEVSILIGSADSGENISQPVLDKYEDDRPVTETSSASKRQFLMALGALGVTAAIGCDSNKPEQKSLPSIYSKPELSDRSSETDRVLVSTLESVKKEYRNVPVKKTEKVLENVDMHLDVLIEATVSIYVVTGIIRFFRKYAGICINKSHLVLAVQKAESLLTKYQNLDTPVLRSAVTLEKRMGRTLKRTENAYDREYQGNAAELKSKLAKKEDIDSFGNQLALLSWTLAKTERERSILLNNATEMASLSFAMYALAYALQKFYETLVEMHDELKKLGCDLSVDQFSNSRILNYLVGDVMGEARKDTREVIHLIQHELKANDSREDEVRKVQRFFVDTGLLDDNDPTESSINGEYNRGTLKAANLIKSVMLQFPRWSRIICKHPHFKTKPGNPTVRSFQMILMSLGYLDANYEAKGSYDAQTNDAYKKFHLDMTGNSLECE